MVRKELRRAPPETGAWMDLTPTNIGRHYYRVSAKSDATSSAAHTAAITTALADGERRISVPEDEHADHPLAKAKDRKLFKQMLKQHPDAAPHLRALFPESVPTRVTAVGMTDTKATMVQSEINAAIRRGMVDVAKGETHFSKECITVTVLLVLTTILIMLSAISVIGFSIRKDSTAGDESSSTVTSIPWVIPADDNKPIRTVVKYNVSYNDPIYRDRNHTTVCVYQGKSQNRVSMGSEYGLPLFPFPYCHRALYCCLAITQRYEIHPEPGNPRAFYGFTTLVESNPILDAYAIVGGQLQDSMSFQKMLKDTKARSAFIKNAKAWCTTNKFHGLYLYWDGPPEEVREDLSQMFRDVGHGLASIGRKLGVIVTQDPSHYPAFDVGRLARDFGENSILLAPLRFSAVDYTPHTFAYYDNETISVTSTVLGNQTDLSNNNVCFMLPAAALTFRMADTNSSVRFNDTSLGPGPGGPIMKQAGVLSYTEICAATRNCAFSAALYSEEAICNDVWITYPTLASMRRFMCDMQRSTGITCFGLWDSDWDDFAGRCGVGDFPLMETIFKRGLYPCE